MSHTIVTPGKKWIPAAKIIANTDTKGDLSVSGFYKRVANGTRFYDLDGTLFAFLVSNNHRERFFVTAHTTGEGIRYMHSTCSITERMLGIEDLGYRDQKMLEDAIVNGLDAHKAYEILAA